MSKMTAISPDGNCPLWKAFLLEIMNNDFELVAYLQRVFGYSLTGLTTEDALFFFYGMGANGKTTLLNTVSKILGDYAISSPSSVFTAKQYESHPTELARLHNRRLVTSSEIEPNQIWAESRLKQLTGGDTVTARGMRQDFFDFTPQLKLVIAGNNKPGLNDVTEATRRRFHLIPFDVTIPVEKRDKDFENKLKPEWPGILRWMIEGCVLWQREGLKPPKAVVDATESYLQSQDHLATWLEDCCDIKPCEGVTLISEARGSYNNWAKLNNKPALGRDDFRERMKTKGFVVERINRGSVFKGLTVCNPF